jgi:hypothetical protein
MVRLEGLGQLKNPMASSVIETSGIKAHYSALLGD